MKLDDVKKLHQKKYRAEFGHYLIEGEHLVMELQKSLAKTSEAKQITLYVTESRLSWAKSLTDDFKRVVVSDKKMSQLSDTQTPQGVVACVPLPTHSESHAPQTHDVRNIFLHQVQDPGNLGTIIRTLAWFGGFRLLLSPNSVDPFNSKVVRASMGAIFHLPIEVDCPIEALPQRFNKMAYLDLQGTAITAPEFGDFDCYLFGNEARGVPNQALAEFNAEAFTIAGSGTIDSLNLASSVGICAYQLSI
ncbi:RNA methyltransferase [Alteromonas sediminis]|uniref:RNA methyltransferase n=1 Tax=Alteromonas sediminis TaxID=2259342 RepID=A0A3N5XYU0_9ALTE|nr:RNA methyltransferase [Alteromonas sediminis]RPJ65810.1 RNA methyltransferase [Alteromonas sediminis]